MGSGRVIVGVDVGQKVDPTAIVVCEQVERVSDTGRLTLPQRAGMYDARDIQRVGVRTETIHTARHLQRLPLGMPYPEVAAQVAAVVEGLVRRGITRPRIMVDATGVGGPVVDILRERLGRHARDLIAATFTHGGRYSQDDSARLATVGKAYLVSRLQALLQTSRLKLPQTAEAEQLARELQNYEIRIDDDANDRYGAFRTGTHDDLVTALGLCVVYREPADRHLRGAGSRLIPQGGY